MSLTVPFSSLPITTGKVYPDVFVGATNSKREEGIGVIASLDADATWSVRFLMPSTLPSGTAKLKLLALASATSGVAKVNPKWASVAAEESPDIAAGSLNAEGVQTVTWASGDSDVYKELEIALDADTVAADEVIVMDIVFETSSWTLAAKSVWQAFIVWD